MKKFLFLGGDLRMLYAAEYLNSCCRCSLLGFDKAQISSAAATASFGERFDAVVLPLPTSVDGVHINAPYCAQEMQFDTLEHVLLPAGTVYTSKYFPALDALCEKNGFLQVNYFAREELQLMNAVPTAEGALELALESLPITLFGASVLITGFGRIARVLAGMLNAFGARVSVAARKFPALAAAETMRCRALNITDELDPALHEFDLVLNTVPAPIFTRNRLAQLKKGCLIIDLASKSGVEDLETAGNLGVNVIWALSLPGKTAPVSAGRIIGRTISNMLEEEAENEQDKA